MDRLLAASFGLPLYSLVGLLRNDDDDDEDECDEIEEVPTGWPVTVSKRY